METYIRNIDAILYYIDSKGYYISNNIRNKIRKYLIQGYVGGGYPNREYYKKKLLEIDFSREYVENDIIKRKIDIFYRINNCINIVKAIEPLVDKLLKEEKDFLLYHNNEKMYRKLMEEITFDGLVYDLVSLNELGERICIEVKTNIGKRDKPFFISKKEIEIMHGYKEEFDCKYCFIYYVLLSDKEVTIKKINFSDFDTYKLEPLLYKIKET